ncbi:MAG TPA: (2Fe-2S)-binding protein [Candidatus Acidoferrum sp.]|nr:(2Fe-2S)-binding protein [Candidatus Acidoferrum sp.]
MKAQAILERRFSFILNGRQVSVSSPPAHTLLEVLRERLEVTGPKEDCAKGECGACTVLMNGRPVLSCLVLMSQAEGAEIVTSEGFMKDGLPDYIQKAFIDNGAVQCGHCIPGFIVSTEALLSRNPNPSSEDVKMALAGNLCRCTGYTSIIGAVKDAAHRKTQEPSKS